MASADLPRPAAALPRRPARRPASTPAPHEIRGVRGFAARDVRINGQPLALPSPIA